MNRHEVGIRPFAWPPDRNRFAQTVTRPVFLEWIALFPHRLPEASLS